MLNLASYPERAKQIFVKVNSIGCFIQCCLID